LWSFDGLISAFNENKKQCGSTNVIISHQEKILSVADKIIVMEKAEVAMFGEPKDVMPNLQVGRQCMKLQGDFA
jgi:Fe-S cluster assembly ATP-binding protein